MNPPVLHFFLVIHISIPVLYEKCHTILYRKVLHFPYIIVRIVLLYSNFRTKIFSVSWTFILLLNDTNFYPAICGQLVKTNDQSDRQPLH